MTGSKDEDFGGPYVVEDHVESINGHFVPGDEVLDVQKLEPVALNSLTFVLTDKTFPVLVKNVRTIDIQMDVQELRRSSRIRSRYAPRTVFELPESERDRILASLADANAVAVGRVGPPN